MTKYIGKASSFINVEGYTNSQIDTAISTAIAAAGSGVEVSATEPSSPSEGDLWYDSTTGVKVLKYYNGTAWFKVSSEIPTLTSISGGIYAGIATTLTLSGTNFLDLNLVVNFTQASDSIDVDVTVTPTSNTSATVAVPSSVYDSVTLGNVVSIKVTNSEGPESNTVSKTAAALPTGGTITTSGGYRYHEFTSSSDFVVSSELTGVDYIVVAAGGGGAGWGGGGGAGGLINQTSQTLSAATYPIVLGAGGYGASAAAGYTAGVYTVGGDGGDTTFNSLTAIGGGGGGNYTGNPGRAGGSGGGGGGYNLSPIASIAGGSGTAGQGNAGGGGGGFNGSYHSGGGGGGGAGAQGGDVNGYGLTGGSGGAGLAPTGFSNFGDSGYFAGGAGGHTDRRAGAGVSIGGVGGGGNGGGYSTNTNAGNGGANTGGGGGGSFGQSSDALCGHGGSGTVIIRYAI